MQFRYDIGNMQKLLESFYTLTKLRIVVFDCDLEKIADYPEYHCEFCTLIRTNPIARAKCLQSDRLACARCRETGQLYAYTCHTGLTEIVTPIRQGNIITGYMMFGQVLKAEEPQQSMGAIRTLAKIYNLPEEELAMAYRKQIPLDNEQLIAAAQILEACAGYLWLKRYISLKENSLIQALDAYVEENLGGDLSVQALCQRFQISRSRLYKLFQAFYGCSVERLTRRLRIEKARALLANTAQSVSDVAAAVGYGDYNYFIKVFRAETGLTPLQYRKTRMNPEEPSSAP